MATIPDPQNEAEKKQFQQEMDPTEKFLRNVFVAVQLVKDVQNDTKTKEEALLIMKDKFLY